MWHCRLACFITFFLYCVLHGSGTGSEIPVLVRKLATARMAHISGHYGHFIADLETAEAAMASGGTGGEAPPVKTEAEVTRGQPSRDSEDDMTDGEEVHREVPAIPAAGTIIDSPPPSSLQGGRQAGDLLNIALQKDHLNFDLQL